MKPHGLAAAEGPSDSQVPFERHFTVGELARQWHLAPATVRRMFDEESGVIRIGERRLRRGKQRTYVSLRVPASTAARVYAARTRSL
jgi:hypothetical protein